MNIFDIIQINAQDGGKIFYEGNPLIEKKDMTNLLSVLNEI